MERARSRSNEGQNDPPNFFVDYREERRLILVQVRNNTFQLGDEYMDRIGSKVAVAIEFRVQISHGTSLSSQPILSYSGIGRMVSEIHKSVVDQDLWLVIR